MFIADIWKKSDSFHYLYGSTSGDASIEMFVEDITEDSMGGLMLRDSLDANSKHFSLFIYSRSNKLLSNSYRSHTGADALANRKRDTPISNLWLKLTKTGNVFKSYYKTDNAESSWIEVGTQTIHFSSNTFYYGIAVTSFSTTRLATLNGYVNTELSDSPGLKMTAYNEALSSQQFRTTENDQLESIYCPGKVLSVAVQATSWMCKKGDKEIGLVTVDGSVKPHNSVCTTSKEKYCSHGDCTIGLFPISHDYCVNGNRLLLENSRPNDESQKWRFYQEGIMNLACKREPLFQGMVISQIDDNKFQDVSLFEDLEISFVNDGTAISVGEVVSLKFLDEKNINHTQSLNFVCL